MYSQIAYLYSQIYIFQIYIYIPHSSYVLKAVSALFGSPTEHSISCSHFV